MSKTPNDDPMLKAAERELARLKRFGERLTALKPPDDMSQQDAQALQDANLAAFEAMTEEVGMAALDRMTFLVEELQASIENSNDPKAAENLAPRMRAAAEDLDALREKETERLMSRIETLLEQHKGNKGTGE